MVNLEWLDLDETWYLYDSSDGRVLGRLVQICFTGRWMASQLKVYGLSIPGSQFEEMYVGLQNSKTALLEEVRTRYSQWSILTEPSETNA